MPLPRPGALSSVCAGYTIHADAAVRQAATDVLRRSIKALPGHRNEILLGMAAFLAQLSEDHPEVRTHSPASSYFFYTHSLEHSG